MLILKKKNLGLDVILGIFCKKKIERIVSGGAQTWCIFLF